MAEQKKNPSNPSAKTSAERKRIPMSVPVQRLEVPEIPGYHLHWFNGTSARIQRALDGGYEFVTPEETEVNSVSLGGDSAASGNTDMGSRVTIASGQEDGNGQALRLVLMKIKLELYDEDQQVLEERNDRVAQALTAGSYGSERDSPADRSNRYVDKSRTSIPDLFRKKRRI